MCKERERDRDRDRQIDRQREREKEREREREREKERESEKETEREKREIFKQRDGNTLYAATQMFHIFIYNYIYVSVQAKIYGPTWY